MKLTIEHLAAYLPYEVKCIAPAHQYGIKSLIKELDCYMLINMVNNDTLFKPLLRPLSDLTKEIKHNGERFVPIEWFEIGDDSNDSVEYNNGNIKLIRSLESLSKNGFANEVEYFPYGVITKLLSWHFDCFGLIESGLAIPIKPIDNKQH